MSISYTLPLSKAFIRMKKALFQPFNINKWFRIGFTAWLAGFTDCSGNGSGSGGNSGSQADWDEFFNFPQTASDWLMDNPLWTNLIVVGIVLLVVIITIVIWISSRGKFMFVHNVANDSDEISKVWHQYRKQGNSLFFFQFFYGWLAFIAFIGFLVYCFLSAKTLYHGHLPNIAIFWGITQMVLILIAYLITFGFISLFLKDFVVPIMYKNEIGVLKAWSVFMKLFVKNFVTFTVYGLFIFVLGIAVGIGIVALAILTCCIGLILLAIPYIGAVALLPVTYTFRAYSLEFLAQFGEDYNLFPMQKMETEEGSLGPDMENEIT